jgi:organic hydroperoxide reductase OsmC/OhrA
MKFDRGASCSVSMGQKEHHYRLQVKWTGNKGTGTSAYDAYWRDHEISKSPGTKSIILGSSDPAFRGDPSRWNPEELLLAAVSACHKLWFLSLAAKAGVIVHEYTDDCTGTMIETPEGGGHFTRIVLRPQVRLASDAMRESAEHLHHVAHEKCFIANSVSFPIQIEATWA